MGLPSRQPVHARHRHGPDRRHDPRKAPPQRPAARRAVAAGLILLALLRPASAETLRLAYLNANLSQRGPGLLYDQTVNDKNPQIAALVTVVAAVAPDVLVLSGLDLDAGQVTVRALADRFGRAGQPYPHLYAPMGNAGLPTGLDLDGDGRLGGPGDAQGFGAFGGAGGIAVFSRLPIDTGAARDFSAFLWADLPGGLIEGAALSPQARAVQRLASTAFLEVPVIAGGTAPLRLLLWHGAPPVFDGPEDRNGRRSRDETAFWSALLAGRLPMPPPAPPFVVMGDANTDPADGDGRKDALAALLADPALQDPQPTSPGGTAAARAQGGANAGQRGDPARDTADLKEAPGPGNLRTDYILPWSGLRVLASGVYWPAGEGEEAAAAIAASDHRMVWVDVALP